MKYRTGNPVGTDGSTDPRDMYDNAGNLDKFLTSEQPTFPDRLNKTRPTLKGFEIEHQSALDAIIMVSAGDFFTGTVVTARNQTVLWSTSNGGNGHEFRWAGALNKTVPAGSTPLTTGGIYPDGQWIDVGVTQLRRDLAPVEGIKHLRKIPNIRQTALSFHDGLGIAGCDYIWLPEVDQSKHLQHGPHGGILWSSNAIDVYNGTRATLHHLLSWEGVGFGCFEQILLQGTARPELDPCLFGATGGGVDDTLPWQICVGKDGNKVKPSPLAYSVSELIMGNSVSISADSGLGYTGDNELDDLNLPRLEKRPGAKCLLNVAGKRGIFLRGIVLDGVDRLSPVISSGSSRFTAEYCRMIRGSHGFGGPITGASSYSSTPTLHKCILASNVTGLRNPIDGFFGLCEIANNDTNVSAAAGANSNVFIGGRIEWAKGRNLDLGGTSSSKVGSWIFSGTIIDRGHIGSIRLVHCTNIQFESVRARRGNASGSVIATEDNLVVIENCSNITFTNFQPSRGTDDNGAGLNTPNHVVYFNGTNDRITFSGGAVPDNFESFLRNSGGVTNLQISAVSGVADFSNAEMGLQIRDGSSFRSESSGDVGAGNSRSDTLKTRLKIDQFQTRLLDLTIIRRDQVTGSDSWAKIGLVLQREGGSASIALTIIAQNSSIFSTGGDGTINLSVGAVSDDGSEFVIVTQNTGLNSSTIRFVLK